MRDIANCNAVRQPDPRRRATRAALGRRRRAAANRDHDSPPQRRGVGRQDQLLHGRGVRRSGAQRAPQYLRKGSRVFVDAELDWREWTDKHDNKREAVTFKARQVLFEGGRPAPAVAADGSDQQNAAGPQAAAPADGEPVGVSASEPDGSASADDLPF